MNINEVNLLKTCGEVQSWDASSKESFVMSKLATAGLTKSQMLTDF